MADRIQIRRDTAANFTSVDPTLAQGEMGYELDTGKLKFGDGATAWTSLGYFGGTDGDAIHDNVAAEISAIASKATPTSSDYLLIEDAADSNNKKKITLGGILTPSIAHSATTGKTANDHHNQQHALGSGADHTSATLAELNTLVSDATLDGSGDSRTPTAHNTSHQSGGSDAIKLDDLAAPDDNTDLNVSTSAHGLTPKLPNDSTQYLDGTGAYSVPAGGGGGSTKMAVGHFGGKFNSTATFAPHLGKSTDVCQATSYKVRCPIPLAGTLSEVSYQCRYGDTTTQMKIHINGTVEETFTLSDIGGTYNSGVETVSVSVLAGDVLELEYDDFQKPGEGTWIVIMELS